MNLSRRTAIARLCGVTVLAGLMGTNSAAQGRSKWRSASPAELEAALPDRAPVEKERIETEMRTATGIINDKHELIAAVVLITAGYAADGKYSHFLLVQAPIVIDDHLSLAPGSYVVGWKREEAGLVVHFFDAATGVERGAGLARPAPQQTRVESFRIWPPTERSRIQIGRFFLSYTVKN